MEDPRKYITQRTFSRREFLRLLGLSGAGAILAACGGKTTPTVESSSLTSTSSALPSTVIPASEYDAIPTSEATTIPPPTSAQAYLAVVRGTSPAAMTTTVIAALGGIERFVKSGANVIIKPNICTDNHPYEYAATTNPQVVATLVRLCLGAGASRVRVMDNPFSGSAQSAYAISGIAEAVAAAGGEMEVMNRNKFVKATIPAGKDIKEWPFYQDILEADLVINVPIAKHHSLARLTLGGKNLLGVIAKPSAIHANLGQRIADLVSRVRPALTVVDAVRILMNHGPSGGNLDDVKLTNTVIASHDIVAADAYAATLFGLTGADISYIQAAADSGLGRMDLSSVKIEEINT